MRTNEHLVVIPNADWGALHVALLRNMGGRHSLWLTFVGPRGGRHLTISLGAEVARELALRLRQGADALTRDRPTA